MLIKFVRFCANGIAVQAYERIVFPGYQLFQRRKQLFTDSLIPGLRQNSKGNDIPSIIIIQRTVSFCLNESKNLMGGVIFIYCHIIAGIV